MENSDNKQNENPIKSSDGLYLEKLDFDPALRKSWLNFFVSNFRVVILLIILLTAWGIYSFFRLPRESNPEVKIPIAVVLVSYPGVSPADMEELVTKKVENKVSGIKGIKKLTSRSANSISTVTVEFEAGENLEDSIKKLRDEASSLKSDLPAEANEPVVQEISFDDRPVLSLALTGPFDGFTLRHFADEIKDELEKVSGVREVNISGGDQKEFQVAYDPQKLAFYNITPDQANQAIKTANLAIPAGNFEGREFNYPVRADSRIFDAKKLSNLPVTHTREGAIIYLKDLAKVEEKAIERTRYSRLSIKGDSPQEAVTIDVVKKTGGNIIKLVDASKISVGSYIKTAPEGLKYDITTDYAKIIKEDFDQLTHDFLFTIILVFTILFLIVGLKEALVAGLAVPLVFFATFGAMDATGTTLNFLSMFSLILSLGLLVDDAIVVVSATKQYLGTGKFTPEEAVLLVLNDFKVVLTTTTLTTIWAFLPLLSTSGIIGQFIKSIPITVSITLTFSLLIALMINHPLAAVLERVRLTKPLFFFYIALLAGSGLLSISTLQPVWMAIGLILLLITSFLMFWYLKKGGALKMNENKVLVEKEWDSDELIKKKLSEQGSQKHSGFFSKLLHGYLNLNIILPYYEKYLRKMMETKKNRLTVLGITFSIFVCAVLLPVIGIVPSEFFPASDQPMIFVDIRTSTGLNLDRTNEITAEIENKLLEYKEIANFSTTVGSESSGGSVGVSSNSSNLANITINLVDKKERKSSSYELADRLRKEFKQITDAQIAVESPSSGPPSGSAFEARIIGEDLSTLDKISRDLEPILASIPGVADTEISLRDSPAEYTFTLDHARMELYSLNSAYVGSMLRTAISGVEVTKIIREGEETKVIARFDKQKLPSLESVQNLQILNLAKQPVFIKDVAKIELKPSVESISRIDQKRTVLLSAGVSGKTRSNDVLKMFQEKISSGYKMSEGYSIIYGGENEQNTESVFSILRAMAIAGILIISTLIIQFNSFKKAVIVLVTIPLALIGVFFGLAIFRVTLSFPGLIGILALFGIVVKNAIILVDKINLNIKTGIPYEESIIDAGKSRLEAIFITSVCTIVGIIPVTLSNAVWMALGSAVIFGLMLSSFFTLIIIPVLFRTLVGEKERL